MDLSEESIGWLRRQTTDPTIGSIDPYRDVILDASGQRQFLESLVEVREGLAAHVLNRIVGRRDLPRDAIARESVVELLLARELAKSPHWTALVELVSLIELAVEERALVRGSGD